MLTNSAIEGLLTAIYSVTYMRFATQNLILKHYDGTNNNNYVENRYIFMNGASGIEPTLISENNGLSFSALNVNMEEKIPAIIPAPTFEGWYVKDEENGNHEKLLDTEGNIVSDITGSTQDFKFNVNPGILHCMRCGRYHPI